MVGSVTISGLLGILIIPDEPNLIEKENDYLEDGHHE